MQYVLAVADICFLLGMAYFVWLRVRFNRQLRKIEAEQGSSA